MYARKAGKQTLTLSVSGMLWNRSLVMKDSETGSLWSHLLGKAMSGKLQGTTLASIPSEMTTWEAWRREHPQTTVLNLSRTARKFTRDVYRRPADFVFAWVSEGHAYDVSLAVLSQTPLLNVSRDESAWLVVYNSGSTAARLFSPTYNKQTLTFIVANGNLMRDRQTRSLWNRTTGEAVEGPLKGARLSQLPGIMSFTRAWRVFHPDSDHVKQPNKTGKSSGKPQKSFPLP